MPAAAMAPQCSEQQSNEDLTMTCFMQVIGSEPEYSSCHGRVIATLDYIWYSETSYDPASSCSSEARSPADKAKSQSRSPEGSQHAGSSAARLAELQNGDSQSQRGMLLQCIPCKGAWLHADSVGFLASLHA